MRIRIASVPARAWQPGVARLPTSAAPETVLHLRMPCRDGLATTATMAKKHPNAQQIFSPTP